MRDKGNITPPNGSNQGRDALRQRVAGSQLSRGQLLTLTVGRWMLLLWLSLKTHSTKALKKKTDKQTISLTRKENETSTIRHGSAQRQSFSMPESIAGLILLL